MCDLPDDESPCYRSVGIAIPALAFSAIAFDPDMARRHSHCRHGIRIPCLDHVALEPDDPLDCNGVGIPRTPSKVVGAGKFKCIRRPLGGT